MTQIYTAFGLVYHSEIALPFAPAPPRVTVDVTIAYGKTPDAITGTPGHSRQWQAAPGEFLLSCPGVGSFWVKDGDRITLHIDHGLSLIHI